MSKVQSRAEEMMDHHGFLGVPKKTYEVGGRTQFIRLLENGLVPESRVLEIGCGTLRVAYWLTRFLNSGCYAGIEPAYQRVELGRQYLFTEDELAEKQARFDHNADFDTSVFRDQFDYFLAGSIWTHCGKEHINTMLDGFERNTGPNGIFLTSYLPAAGPDDDYMGTSWVGTSHESNEPGVVHHSLDWIKDNCVSRGLKVTLLAGRDCDAQYWLRLDKG